MFEFSALSLSMITYPSCDVPSPFVANDLSRSQEESKSKWYKVKGFLCLFSDCDTGLKSTLIEETKANGTGTSCLVRLWRKKLIRYCAVRPENSVVSEYD